MTQPPEDPPTTTTKDWTNATPADPWSAEGLPRPGTTVVARYRLEHALARGGMSMVYRARDLFQDSDCALKVLPRQLRTPQSHARFMREARLASLVEHPNVVATLDAGLFEDGTPYIVMELLRGRSLYRVLEDEGRLSFEAARDVTLQVCDGVGAAHQRRVIHRDLKPSNVLLLQDGVAKVIDFGLSKEIHDPTPAITGPSEALGTPSYMSPEQVFAEEADERTDVWGVGILFYELLTGTPAFPYREQANGPERDAAVQRTFYDILHSHPQSVSTLDLSGIDDERMRALDAFFASTWDKEPDRRFQSMASLGDALRAL